jgi:hydrogenase/urease accessory protein HupE
MFRWFSTLHRLILACLLPVATAADAHVSDTSLLRVQIHADKLQIEANADLLTLNRVVRLDSDGDGTVTRGEFAKAAPLLEEFFRKKLRLKVGEEASSLGSAQVPEWQSSKEAASENDFQSVHVSFVFERVRPVGARGFRLEDGVFDAFGSAHNVIFAVVEGETTQQAVLTEETPGLDYDFATQSKASTSNASSHTPGSLFGLGVHHVLEGYDHLLFLLTLLVAATGWRQMVWIITAFTAAHSLTLGLAVVGVTRLPEKWVECTIAASIAWVAAENLWKGGGENRWRQTFLFGLIHGFGFAGALMALQLPREGLAWSLLLFNAGVEAGQLLVVATVFPVLHLLRRTPFRGLVLRGLSFGSLATALVWLGQRLAA